MIRPFRLPAVAILIATAVPITAQPLYQKYRVNSANEETAGFFGSSVAGVPDVDGDGRGDFVAGAWREDPPGAPDDAGRAYVFSGATGALLHTLASPNQETSGYFGFSVAGVPDVTGDGRGDIVVGAYREDPSGSPDEAGRAYVFNGATGALVRTLISPSDEQNGRFGYSVAGVPDVNADGRGEVLVGAPGEDPGSKPTECGAAYLFDGATGALLRTFASQDEEEFGNFGFSVAAVPDATGDGRPDVLIGAPNEDLDGGPTNAGRAYFFSGSTGAWVRTYESTNERALAQYGFSVAGVPDLSGDGLGEVLIGAPLEDTGRAYLYNGASGAFLRAMISPNEETTTGQFGFSVAGIPDANGDGRGDILIGTNSEDPSGSPDNAGRAHFFDGLTGFLLQSIVSPRDETDGFFGYSVAGVPDATGDGRGDLLIGAFGEDPDTSPNQAGRVYLYSTQSGAAPTASAWMIY